MTDGKRRSRATPGGSKAADEELGGIAAGRLPAILAEKVQGDALLTELQSLRERVERQGHCLRASEDHFRLLYEQAPLGYQSLDADGCILEVNPAWLELLGYRRDEVIGRSFADFLPPADQALFRERFPRFKANGLVRNVEFSLVRRDGTPVAVSIDGRIAHDERGAFVRTHCIVRDVSEQRRTEAALRASEMRYHTIADFTYDWETWEAPDGTWEYVSPACERITGYRVAEFIAAPGLLRELILPEDRPAWDAHHAAEQATADAVEVHFRLRRRDGAVRWIEHACRPVHDAAGRFIGCRASNRDITARKQVEESARRSTALLNAIQQAQSAYIARAEPRAVFEALLQTLITLTGSEFGFLDEVRYDPDGTPYKLSLALSNIAWSPETEAVYNGLRERRFEFRNLRTLAGRPALTGEPVIANDAPHDPRAGGLPPGHPAVRSFMGLPLVFGDEIVGVAGVANRAGGYDEEIARFLAPFLAACASIVHAMRLKENEREAVAALRASEEQHRALVQLARAGIWAIDLDARTTYTNPRMAEMLGYSADEMAGRALFDFVAPETVAAAKENFERRRAGLAEQHEFEFVRKDGQRMLAELATAPLWDGAGRFSGAFAVITDITARRQSEIEREETLELLRLVNAAGDLRRLLQELTAYFQRVTGCEAVGVRLQEGDDYPYYESRGFAPEFTEQENRLCLLDAQGAVVRDGRGNPVLECMCGNILCGRFDPARPFFTPEGSFWTNSTTALLASTTAAERQARTRNRCHGEGFESVALIPLRAGGRTLGLFQFNDHRPGRFSADRIAHFERLVNHVAITVLHRQTVAALAASEERYRQIVETANEGIWSMDGAYRTTFVNRHMAAMLGYAQPEMLGRPVTDFMFPEDLAAHAEQMRQRRQGRAGTYERRFRRKDGGECWTIVSATTLPDARGAFAGSFAMFTDITERKQAERAAQLQAERFRLLTEATRDAVFDIDLVTGAVWRSERYAELFGIPERGRVEERRWENRIHPDDRSRVLAAEDRLFSGAAARTAIEYRLRRMDGAYADVLQRAGRVCDAAGQSIRVVGTLTDITERKRALEQLRESEERYRLALRATNDVIWDWDVAANMQRWNANGALVFGWQDIVDRPQSCEWWVERVHPEDRARVSAGFHAVVADAAATHWHDEYRFRRNDGTYAHVFDRGFVMRDEHGAPLRMIGAMLDITERIEAAAALRQSEETRRVLLNAAPDSSFLIDREGTVLVANETGARRINRSVAEVVGANVFTLIPPETAAVRRKWIADVLRAKEPRCFEDQRGELRLEHHLHPVLDARGEVCQVAIFARDITATRRLEAELRAAEVEARLTLDATSGGIWKWDFRTGEMFYSPRYYRMLGYSPGEFPATFDAWAAMLHPDDRPHALRVAEQWLTTKPEHYENEFRLRTKAGTYRWIESRATVVGRDEHCLPLRLIGSHEDITERKQAEEVLRASEERFRTLVTNLPGVAFRCDVRPPWRVHYSSDGVVALLGYAATDFVDAVRLYPELVDPEDLPGLERAVAEAVATGQPFTNEHRVRHADGSMRWVMARGRAAYAADGAPVWLDGVLLDVTSRRLAEEERVRLATVIEQAAEAVVITDTAGQIQYVNHAFERITGYARAEAIGQNPRLLKSGRQDRRFYEELWTALTRGETWHGRFVNRRKDGTLYEEEASIAPVFSGVGKLVNFVAVKRDITQELAVAEQLRQAQKMEAVGQLAAGVAHDFNNLLTAIYGYVDLARQCMPPGHAALEPLQGIEAATQNAVGVARGLLTFSGRSAARRGVLDLCLVLRDAALLLRRLLPARIALEVSVPEHTCLPVHADPTHLQQVLMNLAVNARDAMPEGGALRIAAGRAPDLTTGAAPSAAGKVWITVSDTGTGIPAEVQARMFEPFFTTKAPGAGTGLGLAITQTIVKEHGGSIEVASTPGAGTTFRIWLPAAPSADTTHAAAAVERLARGQGELVLLAEDDQHVRSVLAQALDDHGFRVLAAADGAELWTLFRRYEQSLRLLVFDVDLPERNGLDCLAGIRARGCTVPAIVITAQTALTPGVLGPADWLLPKPFPLGELLRNAARLLAQAQKGSCA